MLLLTYFKESIKYQSIHCTLGDAFGEMLGFHINWNKLHITGSSKWSDVSLSNLHSPDLEVHSPEYKDVNSFIFPKLST